MPPWFPGSDSSDSRETKALTLSSILPIHCLSLFVDVLQFAFFHEILNIFFIFIYRMYVSSFIAHFYFESIIEYEEISILCARKIMEKSNMTPVTHVVKTEEFLS